MPFFLIPLFVLLVPFWPCGHLLLRRRLQSLLLWPALLGLLLRLLLPLPRKPLLLVLLLLLPLVLRHQSRCLVESSGLWPCRCRGIGCAGTGCG